MMLPGFADPVLGAQSCFRAILEAMSRPGRVQSLPLDLTPPAPLAPATAAVLLTLVDAETPLWSDAGEAAEAWVRFHCGCPMVSDPAAAAFVLATQSPPALTRLDAGTDEEPQASATLILQAEGLAAGVGWHLTGPGIESEHRLMAQGVPADFLASRAKLEPLFPRGVDVILCAGPHIAALPRSLQIREG